MAQRGQSILDLFALPFLFLQLLSLFSETVLSVETYLFSTKEAFLDKRNVSLQMSSYNVVACAIACHQHCCLEFSFYGSGLCIVRGPWTFQVCPALYEKKKDMGAENVVHPDLPVTSSVATESSLGPTNAIDETSPPLFTSFNSLANNPWIVIDTQASHRIFTVRIIGGTMLDSFRKPTSVFIGETITTNGNFENYTLLSTYRTDVYNGYYVEFHSIDGIKGRYVGVQMKGQSAVLRIRDLQIYATKLQESE